MEDPRLALEPALQLSAVKLHPDQQIELLVANLPLARALFDGVPCARLLARTQLGRDTLISPRGTRSFFVCAEARRIRSSASSAR